MLLFVCLSIVVKEGDCKANSLYSYNKIVKKMPNLSFHKLPYIKLTKNLAFTLALTSSFSFDPLLIEKFILMYFYACQSTYSDSCTNK